MAQPSTDGPQVVIIAEDGKRSEHLAAAVARQGLHVQVWDPRSIVVDGAQALPNAVYVSRLSASGGTRLKSAASQAYSDQMPPPGEAIKAGRALLSILELSGATVLNGSKALLLEDSKATQAAAARRVGLPFVPTTLATSVVALAAVDTLPPDSPRVVKPNCGGSGWGVHAFRNQATFLHAIGKAPGALQVDIARGDAAAAAAGAAVPRTVMTAQGAARAKTAAHTRQVAVDMGVIPPPLPLHSPGLWVMQPWVGHFATDAGAMKQTYRAEFVGFELLYVLKIVSPAHDFALCPCDSRAAQQLAAGGVIIVQGEDLCGERWGDFVTQASALMREQGVHIGAVEFRLEPAPGGGHAPVVYDINTNTNYAPAVTGHGEGQVPGWDVAAGMIAGVAKRLPPAQASSIQDLPPLDLSLDFS